MMLSLMHLFDSEAVTVAADRVRWVSELLKRELSESAIT